MTCGICGRPMYCLGSHHEGADVTFEYRCFSLNTHHDQAIIKRIPWMAPERKVRKPKNIWRPRELTEKQKQIIHQIIHGASFTNLSKRFGMTYNGIRRLAYRQVTRLLAIILFKAQGEGNICQ